MRIGVARWCPSRTLRSSGYPWRKRRVIRSQIELLQRSLRGPGIHFSWNDPEEMLVEAILTRGDRRMADVIQRAWELGAKLEGWGEYFNFRRGSKHLPIWAWKWTGTPARSAARRDTTWDHISAGVKSSSPRNTCTPTRAWWTTAASTASRAASLATSGDSASTRRGVECPPLGRGKARQPVNVVPVPLYFNDEMSPDRIDSLTTAPQRREGTVSKRLQPIELE